MIDGHFLAQHRYRFQNKMPVLAFILLLMMLGFGHYIKHYLTFFPCFLSPPGGQTWNYNNSKLSWRLPQGSSQGWRWSPVSLCFITDHSQRNKPDSFSLSQMFCSVKPGEVFSVISAAEGNSRFIKLLCEFRGAVKFQTDVQTKEIYFVLWEAVQSIQQQLIHI